MLITKEPRRYSIGYCNWPDFAAECEAGFEIWHSSDMLHIRYDVDEPAAVADCGEDMQHVWEDSCAEFFFAPAADGLYYNLECNCVGKIYFCCGEGRHDREAAPEGIRASIARKGSLGDKAFGLRDERTRWTLALDIPVSAFFRHALKSFDGLRARGNFYKCADASPYRHYLSMAAIRTERPDFHRPEFFEEIIFD